MEEIKIGMIGSVDAGKSSTTSVLINKLLDDGRGSARCRILKHKHEQDTGRTSSITENYLKIPNQNKYISFVDLAGHEKYLKTTMHGLSGHFIDYALIWIKNKLIILNTSFVLSLPNRLKTTNNK